MPGCFPRHFHLQCVVNRGFHLRGDKSLPDELIQLEHGRLEERFHYFGCAHHRGRTDSFVGFLRACGFGFADGHAEIKKWQDASTIVPVKKVQYNGFIAASGTRDTSWIIERSSAKSR